MGRGTRQGLAYKTVASGATVEFQMARDYSLLRIRFMTNDGIVSPGTTGDLVQIEADGQNLFSAASVPIALIADPTDDATAAGSAQGGAHVLPFDDPIDLSNDFPVRVTYTSGAGSASTSLLIVLEAVPNPNQGEG